MTHLTHLRQSSEAAWQVFQGSRLADYPRHCSLVAGWLRSLPATVESQIYSGLKKCVHPCRAFYMYKLFEIIFVEPVYNFIIGHLFLRISTCLRLSVDV